MFWLNDLHHIDAELEHNYFILIVIIGIVLIILTILLCCLLLMLCSCYKIYLNRQYYEYSFNKILLSLQKTHKITAVIEQNGSSRSTNPELSLQAKDLKSLKTTTTTTTTTSSVDKSDRCLINFKKSLSPNKNFNRLNKSKSPRTKKSAKGKKSLPIKVSILPMIDENELNKSNSQTILTGDYQLLPSIVIQDQLPSISSTDPVVEMPLISKKLPDLNDQSILPTMWRKKSTKLSKNEKYNLFLNQYLPPTYTRKSILNYERQISLKNQLSPKTSSKPPTRYILTKDEITPLNVPKNRLYNTPPVYKGRKNVQQNFPVKINSKDDKIYGVKKISSPNDDEPWFLMP